MNHASNACINSPKLWMDPFVRLLNHLIIVGPRLDGNTLHINPSLCENRGTSFVYIDSRAPLGLFSHHRWWTAVARTVSRSLYVRSHRWMVIGLPFLMPHLLCPKQCYDARAFLEEGIHDNAPQSHVIGLSIDLSYLLWLLEEAFDWFPLVDPLSSRGPSMIGRYQAHSIVCNQIGLHQSNGVTIYLLVESLLILWLRPKTCLDSSVFPPVFSSVFPLSHSNTLTPAPSYSLLLVGLSSLSPHLYTYSYVHQNPKWSSQI